MSNDIILTGPPRSGTTLACSLLNELPNTAALHEPMNLKMFPDPVTALEETQHFFVRMRTSILETGTALSKVKGGSIPSNPFADDRTSERSSIVSKGTLRFEKSFSPDFKLVIKQNGHFTFLLPELSSHFPVFVLLRHPVATIASWNTIQAPVAKGNLSVLKTLNPERYHSLERMPDLIERQVALLVAMYNGYSSLESSQFLYYEDLIASRGKSLKNIIPAAANHEHALRSKNKNPLYSLELIRDIKNHLAKVSNAFSGHYTLGDILAY